MLFDLPHVVAAAPPFLKQRGVANRVRIEGGSFFDGFRPALTPTCCRTSSTTGTKSSA